MKISPVTLGGTNPRRLSKDSRERDPDGIHAQKFYNVREAQYSGRAYGNFLSAPVGTWRARVKEDGWHLSRSGVLLLYANSIDHKRTAGQFSA